MRKLSLSMPETTISVRNIVIDIVRNNNVRVRNNVIAIVRNNNVTVRNYVIVINNVIANVV